MMPKGKVQRYGHEQGYGFVLPDDDGKPVFFHATGRVEVKDVARVPAIHDRISYVEQLRRGRMEVCRWAFTDELGGKELEPAVVTNPRRHFMRRR
jgi:hypothetical protein